LYNARDKGLNAKSYETWNTPDFINLKMKRTKRLSPYLETEIWDKDELATIIKYESYKRNKAVLALLWDLAVRPHEITFKNKTYQTKRKIRRSRNSSSCRVIIWKFPTNDNIIYTS
jgi:hypothetical protein